MQKKLASDEKKKNRFCEEKQDQILKLNGYFSGKPINLALESTSSIDYIPAGDLNISFIGKSIRTSVPILTCQFYLKPYKI